MGYELFIRLPRRDQEDTDSPQGEPSDEALNGDQSRPFRHLMAELAQALDATTGRNRVPGTETEQKEEPATHDVPLPELPEPAGKASLLMGPARISVHRPKLAEPALDLTVPEGLTDQQAAQVLAGILEAARKCGLLVFDPQLGRLVGPHDAELLFLEWERMNAYFLDTLGASPGSVAGGAWYPEYEETRSPFATIWMILGGSLLAALVLGRLCG